MAVLEILTGPIFQGSFGKSSKKFMVVLEKLSIIGLIHEKFHKFMYKMRETSWTNRTKMLLENLLDFY
jgi:hypothetical protein